MVRYIRVEERKWNQLARDNARMQKRLEALEQGFESRLARLKSRLVQILAAHNREMEK